MCEGTIVLTCIIIMNSVLCTHRDVRTLYTCTHVGANVQIASDTECLISHKSFVL